MINIKTDSRKVKKGDIFVALDGINSNGSDYIEKAIANGASKVVAKQGNYAVETIVVDDTRAYLNEYLQANYNKYLAEMTIIGITGTNGKTTTAHIIYSVLNKLGIPCASIGSLGFFMDKKIESLANTSPEVTEIYDMLMRAYKNGYKTVVMEASSQGLSYQRLEGIQFDYTVFTNLTIDHLDYHKTMENYCHAKQELFKKIKNNGKAIINIDDEYAPYFVMKQNDNITYGYSDDAMFKVNNYKLENDHTIFTFIYQNKEYKITTKLLGSFNIYNVLASIAVLSNMLPIDRIIETIRIINNPSGRMEKINYKNNVIIVDYAHTPDAMLNIINTVKPFTKNNLYIVFGCTGDRDRKKRPIMFDLATTLAYHVIITIDDLHNEDANNIVKDMLSEQKNSNYEIILDRAKAIHKGIDLLDDNDTLLILGKGHEEVIIIKDEKIPFNDKDVTLKYLEQK